MPGALLGQGSGALFWRASDLTNVTREARGYHVEACFAARSPQEDTGRGAPSAQEFITKATQELQDVRGMRGDRRPPGVAPHLARQIQIGARLTFSSPEFLQVLRFLHYILLFIASYLIAYFSVLRA